MYYQYVDDTFAVFNDEDKCNEFFSHLNSLHPLLLFTFEKECNRILPFLDVLVEKNDHEFVTSIYRKPTFTGQYIFWNSFCSTKRKTNLISTLVHRALVICSKSTLQKELSNIRSILINNGYPEAVINAVITKKMNQFCRPTQLGPKKCPVYIHLPWLGNALMRYKMQIKTAVKRCYFAVEPCIVYTRQLLPAAKNNVLPDFHQSNIVYQFLYHCDSRYVGRTFKGYNRGLSRTCQKPFSRSIFLRTEAHWPALASQSEALKLKFPFLPWDNILYKTIHAHMNITTTNFLFLPMAVLLFTFPPLKPRTLKHPNQVYANKRNSFLV